MSPRRWPGSGQEPGTMTVIDARQVHPDPSSRLGALHISLHQGALPSVK